MYKYFKQNRYLFFFYAVENIIIKQNKSRIQVLNANSNYSEFITLSSIIHFIPLFSSIAITVSKYVYLSALNIEIRAYFQKNPKQIILDLIQIFIKSNLIKGCFISLLVSSLVIFVSQNISLGFIAYLHFYLS